MNKSIECEEFLNLMQEYKDSMRFCIDEKYQDVIAYINKERADLLDLISKLESKNAQLYSCNADDAVLRGVAIECPLAEIDQIKAERASAVAETVPELVRLDMRGLLNECLVAARLVGVADPDMADIEMAQKLERKLNEILCAAIHAPMNAQPVSGALDVKLIVEALMANLSDRSLLNDIDADITYEIYESIEGIIKTALSSNQANAAQPTVGKDRAWIERRYANDELVHETVNLQPMPERQRKELEQHYRIEIVELGPVAQPEKDAEKALPPLPAPAGTMQMNWGTQYAKDVDAYTEYQMRGYAIAAAIFKQPEINRG